MVARMWVQCFRGFLENVALHLILKKLEETHLNFCFHSPVFPNPTFFVETMKRIHFVLNFVEDFFPAKKSGTLSASVLLIVWVIYVDYKSYLYHSTLQIFSGLQTA